MTVCRLVLCYDIVDGEYDALDFVDGVAVAFLFVVAKLIYSLSWWLQSFCTVFLSLAYNSSSWSIMVHA